MKKNIYLLSESKIEDRLAAYFRKILSSRCGAARFPRCLGWINSFEKKKRVVPLSSKIRLARLKSMLKLACKNPLQPRFYNRCKHCTNLRLNFYSMDRESVRGCHEFQLSVPRCPCRRSLSLFFSF